ncbi:hypothetical protein Tco_0627592 [Tanacetum coccineum]|uniref:Uncharacterized protein n=1 Tax=Tanacetum coccineum TaxID=301880 RepID=A0ABQ4WMZ1_9ASTR
MGGISTLRGDLQVGISQFDKDVVLRVVDSMGLYVGLGGMCNGVSRVDVGEIGSRGDNDSLVMTYRGDGSGEIWIRSGTNGAQIYRLEEKRVRRQDVRRVGVQVARCRVDILISLDVIIAILKDYSIIYICNRTRRCRDTGITLYYGVGDGEENKGMRQVLTEIILNMSHNFRDDEYDGMSLYSSYCLAYTQDQKRTLGATWTTASELRWQLVSHVLAKPYATQLFCMCQRIQYFIGVAISKIRTYENGHSVLTARRPLSEVLSQCGLSSGVRYSRTENTRSEHYTIRCEDILYNRATLALMGSLSSDGVSTLNNLD